MTLSKTLLRNSTLAAGAAVLFAGAPAFADNHKEGEDALPYAGEGKMINSGQYDGMGSEEFQRTITADLEAKGTPQPVRDLRAAPEAVENGHLHADGDGPVGPRGRVEGEGARREERLAVVRGERDRRQVRRPLEPDLLLADADLGLGRQDRRALRGLRRQCDGAFCRLRK